jgi:hypothetical protein
MAKFSIFRVSFVAVSAPGPISVPGLEVGDTMILCLQTPPVGSVGYVFPQSEFEGVVSVADQLQQLESIGDGTFTLDAIFLRGI